LLDAPLARVGGVPLSVKQLEFIVYCKGALVAYLLDREIERRAGHRFSLDDIVRAIWAEHGPRKGLLAYDRVQTILLQVTGSDFSDFLTAYVFGSDPVILPGLW
jgi:predicted metalloprotease with PDZ domain